MNAQLPRIGAGALALASAALLASAGGAHALPKLIECQRPVRTGEEIYGLRHVSAATACPVVRDLGHWEYTPISHVKVLYGCTGAGGHTPVLRLRHFEGWRLSITSGGDFRMSRGRRSFAVTGTDFPLNCT